MGKYVPPPYGILALAAYLEADVSDVEIEVVDCQAREIGWDGLEKEIESFRPDVVAPSALGTCNAYLVIRTTELAKKVDPDIKTVVGGQHFSALAEETLEAYPSVDFVVRGEGEQTLAELVKTLDRKEAVSNVKGMSFKHEGKIEHNLERALISDLDALPYPGYNFVSKHMKSYYYALMAGKDVPFAIVEGSRGCRYDCSYCSQWRFWGSQHRAKSPVRIADEFEYLHGEFGSRLFWLTDDNFGLGPRVNNLCDEIIRRGFADDIMWFVQARCDDLVANKDLLPKMRKAGNIWTLVGFDTPRPQTLAKFRRAGVDQSAAKEAVNLLKKNEIFSQGTFIIGEREDSLESIRGLREYASWLDPDLATFMTLTPFPGTEVYDTAKRKGWIEDTNWSNYDMVHAIMSTEHLTREQVQKELYECYRSYFGSWDRIYKGLFSRNPITRKTYQYLARQAILTNLKSLFGQ